MAYRSSVTSSYASTVNFESMLEKQGKLTGSLMVKKYWCVLDEKKLTYYKDAKKSNSSSSFIDLSNIQSVMRASKPNSFQVITSSATHVFIAMTGDLRDQWVKALQDAMAICSRNQSIARQSMSIERASLLQNDVASSSPSPVSPPPKVSSSVPAERATINSANFDYANVADVRIALQRGTVEENKVLAAEEPSDVEKQSRAPPVAAPRKSKLSPPETVPKSPEPAVEAPAETAPPVTESSHSQVEEEQHRTGDTGTFETAAVEPMEAAVVEPEVTVALEPEEAAAIGLEPEEAAAVEPEETENVVDEVDHVEPYVETIDAGGDNGSVDEETVHSQDQNEIPTPPDSFVDVSSAVEEKHSSSPTPDSPVDGDGEHTCSPEEVSEHKSDLISPLPNTPSASRPVVRRRSTLRSQNTEDEDAQQSIPEITVTEIVLEADCQPTVCPDLPYSKLEFDNHNAFNDLRAFLDNNRVSRDVSASILTSCGKMGQAIDTLKFFIANLN